MLSSKHTRLVRLLFKCIVVFGDGGPRQDLLEGISSSRCPAEFIRPGINLVHGLFLFAVFRGQSGLLLCSRRHETQGRGTGE